MMIVIKQEAALQLAIVLIPSIVVHIIDDIKMSTIIVKGTGKIQQYAKRLVATALLMAMIHVTILILKVLMDAQQTANSNLAGIAIPN